MVDILRAFPAAALLLALNCAATAQVAVLQIRVIEGEGAVHAPGSRSTHPLTVEVTDEAGRPVAGAAVSFHLPEEGPGGAFANGIRTEVVLTDGNGHASVHGLRLNRAPGRFQIRILASKEQARAGMVSFQYIAEPGSGAAAAASTAGRSHGYRKWIVVAAVVGAGAAAGILAAEKSGSAPAPAPAITLTIGAPAITVGKP